MARQDVRVDPISRTRGAGLVALIALAAVTVLSLWAVTPPAAKGIGAPADQFSAGRAFRHVQTIGRQVHVAGGPAAGSVRDYIVATLRGYGLDPRIQDAVGADDALGHGYAMAHVHNVVAVLPGTHSTGRIFEVAHYDSVQVSYGGNDDGAGVATLLEAARALTHGPRLANDIVFVFTEAEEACLCGAEAFVSQDPLAHDGGVVLNYEARGSSGPAIMFETSKDNAGVVGVYGRSVPNPVATSFAVEVYRILPNDTDFTPFRESGRFTGLNSAYIDGSAVYHSPEDKPSYMDIDSLAHQGTNALALTRAFGEADIADLATPSAHDETYFPVLGTLIRYPGWLVWPVAAAALLAVIALAFAASRRGTASLGRGAAAFGLALIPLLLSAVVAQLFWLLMVAIRPGYREMIDPWRPGWFRAAVVALVATIVLGWYALFRRRFGGSALAIGGLGWLAALGVVLAGVTPGGSYLASLPALAGALAGIVAMRTANVWVRVAALAIGAAIAVVILAPTVLLFFPALGLATGGAAAVFAAMIGLALLPLLDSLFAGSSARPYRQMPRRWAAYQPVRSPRRAGMPALVAAVLALAFTITGFMVDRFDPAHPAPAQLMYALDTDTGTAEWISTDSKPGSWTKQYLTGTTNPHAQFPPLADRTMLVGTAQPAALPPPVVATVADVTAGGRRTLTLTVVPQRDVRLVYLGIEGATVTGATVDGRAVPPEALDDFGVLFHAPPPGGLPVTLTLADPGPVRVRVMDGSDGLDGLPGFHPRPPGVGVAGSHDTELVLVAKTYVI